jgi:hypothetical protein
MLESWTLLCGRRRELRKKTSIFSLSLVIAFTEVLAKTKMEEKEKGSKGGSEERWKGAIANLTEMTLNLDSLQKLLLKKAVFVNEETFSKASLTSEQARSIKVLDS